MTAVSGNPAGRVRGSRSKLSEAVICALYRDFSKHGEKAIAKVRRDQPGVWLKVLAMLIPRKHKVQHSNSLKDLTDEQLEAMIERSVTSPPRRFRTIQVCPRDLPARRW